MSQTYHTDTPLTMLYMHFVKCQK